jgi:hypothetical protein
MPGLLAALILGCGGGTEPDTATPLTTPPDLTAVVFRSTYDHEQSPEGPLSQYDVWIGAPGAASADAGVVVGSDTPVFLRTGDRLSQTSGASIKVGDTIEVWRDGTVAYGAVECPPGAPCYGSTQIVIRR